MTAGPYQGPIRWRFKGDERLALEYQRLARYYMGMLYHQHHFLGGGQEFAVRNIQLPDGARFKLWHNGHHAIVEIDVDEVGEASTVITVCADKHEGMAFNREYNGIDGALSEWLNYYPSTREFNWKDDKLWDTPSPTDIKAILDAQTAAIADGESPDDVEGAERVSPLQTDTTRPPSAYTGLMRNYVACQTNKQRPATAPEFNPEHLLGVLGAFGVGEIAILGRSFYKTHGIYKGPAQDATKPWQYNYWLIEISVNGVVAKPLTIADEEIEWRDGERKNPPANEPHVEYMTHKCCSLPWLYAYATTYSPSSPGLHLTMDLRWEADLGINGAVYLLTSGEMDVFNTDRNAGHQTFGQDEAWAFSYTGHEAQIVTWIQPKANGEPGEFTETHRWKIAFEWGGEAPTATLSKVESGLFDARGATKVWFNLDAANAQRWNMWYPPNNLQSTTEIEYDAPVRVWYDPTEGEQVLRHKYKYTDLDKPDLNMHFMCWCSETGGEGGNGACEDGYQYDPESPPSSQITQRYESGSSTQQYFYIAGVLDDSEDSKNYSLSMREYFWSAHQWSDWSCFTPIKNRDRRASLTPYSFVAESVSEARSVAWTCVLPANEREGVFLQKYRDQNYVADGSTGSATCTETKNQFRLPSELCPDAEGGAVELDVTYTCGCVGPIDSVVNVLPTETEVGRSLTAYWVTKAEYEDLDIPNPYPIIGDSIGIEDGNEPYTTRYRFTKFFTTPDPIYDPVVLPFTMWHAARDRKTWQWLGDVSSPAFDFKGLDGSPNETQKLSTFAGYF